MLLRKLLILLLLLPGFPSAAFSQSQKIIPVRRFPVKGLGYEDGLLDNNINSIATDGAGFTWISTFTGLQRYDGYKLQTINPVIDEDTFNINYPVFLCALNTGNVLISTRAGLIEYDFHSDRFQLLIPLPARNGLHFSILPLKETEQGLWCLQQDRGVVLYSNNGKLLQSFSFFTPGVANDILRDDAVLYLYIIASSDHYIYINDQLKTILRIDTKNKQGVILRPGDGFLSAIAALYDKLFVGEAGKLIIISENGTGVKKVIPLPLGENITGSTLQVTDDHKLLISRNGHLYLSDTAGNIQYELKDHNKNTFVTNAAIQKIYPDKFNRIWIISNNNIKRIENKELPFENFSYPGNQSNFIRSLYFDTSLNILLAGGYDGVIQAYDTLANPLWKQPVVTRPDEYILNIEKLTSDGYLIIPFDASPFIFNIKTKTNYNVPSSLPDFQNIRTSFPSNLQRLNDSTLLIADNSTVYKCIFRQAELLSAEPLVHCINNKALNCFLYSRGNELWAGTKTGMLYIVKKDKTDSIILPNHYGVRSMAEDNLHHLYIGTEKGLFIYDQDKRLIGNFNVTSGLSNDCIYAISISDSTCFVSTNLGISSISPDGVINNYSKEMGLQDNEFNTNATLTTADGKIFFGGINGITAFYPAALAQIKEKPRIHIIQVTVNDLPQSSSSGIWNGDVIHLDYKHNQLRFDIAAMGILNANEYMYQYRISGLDTNWQKTDHPVNINYTFQPGNYTLEIKCHPLLSSNVEYTKNFSIIITPPFWQTWWFRIITIATLIAIIYIIVHRYNRNKYLKKIRLLETQQQIQSERERISRELHDNIGSQLSLMISNINWTINSADRITKKEEMQRLAAINSSAKNVIANLRESIWALKKEKITLDEFADKLKAHIQNVIKSNPEIELISGEDVQSNIAFSPTETLNIFRVCQEVINNIIKHADATVIRFLVHSDAGNRFSITIEDNGKGFDASVTRNGYGLENMRYRMNEMKLHLQIQSEPGMGTVVKMYNK